MKKILKKITFCLLFFVCNVFAETISFDHLETAEQKKDYLAEIITSRKGQKLFNSIKLTDVVDFADLDQIKYLVDEAGLHLNERSNIGLTALGLVVKAENLEKVEYFLNHSIIDVSNKDMWGNNIFHFLFEKKKNQLSTKTAITANEEKIFNLLLEGRHLDHTIHLIKTPNDSSITFVDLLYKDFNKSIFQKLVELEKQMKLDFDLFNVYRAVSLGGVEAVRNITKYTKRDININYKDDIGNTAVHLAVLAINNNSSSLNAINIFRSLVNYPKVNLDLKNNNKKTAEELVSMTARSKVRSILSERCASSFRK